MAKKILVIEDDPLIRQSVELFLRAEGYEVHEARDSDEALGLLDKYRFNLVLSDVHPPRLEGMDLLSHFRSISPHVPIVIMTASPYGDLSAVPARGVVCVSKPLSFADLRIMIRELI
jgi:two-component system, response regulator FlrC